jgi:hypothetical protein
MPTILGIFSFVTIHGDSGSQAQTVTYLLPKMLSQLTQYVITCFSVRETRKELRPVILRTITSGEAGSAVITILPARDKHRSYL